MIRSGTTAGRGRRVPLWLKCSFTGFVALLVPCYWRLYGPTNFLYFCDLSLFFTLAAVWTESALLASMPAVGILLPQAFWMLDFLSTAAGHPLFGLTTYMFDSRNPLLTRGLSFFHFWLPIVIVYLLSRLGYDRRAFKAWSLFAFGILLICFYRLPPPPAPPSHHALPVNVNYVYGLSDDAPQSWMDPRLYFALVLVAAPTLLYFPTHLVLRRLFKEDAHPTALKR
jgi:hypothetical protein